MASTRSWNRPEVSNMNTVTPSSALPWSRLATAWMIEFRSALRWRAQNPACCPLVRSPNRSASSRFDCSRRAAETGL